MTATKNFPQDFSQKSTPIGADLSVIADTEDLNEMKSVALEDYPISTATRTALGLKVDKETGKSLVPDTVITDLTD